MTKGTSHVFSPLCSPSLRSPMRPLIALFALGSMVVAACAAPVSLDEAVASQSAAGSTAFPNDQTAYDYFWGKGFTNFQAAGIVGNLDQESGIDPTISQSGGGPGRGIAQWSAGGRRWDSDPNDNLVAFAQQEGLPTSSLTVQLDFIMYELNTFSQYGLAKLQATTNVTDAATEFELDFEGCDIASECDVDSRVSYAMDVLNAYGNDPVDVDAGSGTHTDAGGGTGTDAGSTGDTGTGAGGDDGGTPAQGFDATAPVQGTDSGTPVQPSGGGSSEDAGSSSSAATVPSQGSGCAVAPARSGGESPVTWLLAVGLALGVRRRRRASR